jgi:hypothetical protein
MRLLPRVSVAVGLLVLASLGRAADPPAVPDDWAFRPVVRPTAHTILCPVVNDPIGRVEDRYIR